MVVGREGRVALGGGRDGEVARHEIIRLEA
jgi:hypothetical protein